MFIGQCTEEFGYIIDIWKYHLDSNEDFEGVVQDTTGDVIFEVRFDIIAFKPHDKEILDGVVYSVNKDGIEVHSGPLKCYIKECVSIYIQIRNYMFLYRECQITNMIKLWTNLPQTRPNRNQSEETQQSDTESRP